MCDFYKLYVCRTQYIKNTQNSVVRQQSTHKKLTEKLDMVAHVCNPTRERLRSIRRILVPGQLRQNVHEIASQWNKDGCGRQLLVIPAIAGSIKQEYHSTYW
jgi:hypothetical protein